MKLKVVVAHANEDDAAALRQLTLTAMYDLLRPVTKPRNLALWLDASVSPHSILDRLLDDSIRVAVALDERCQIVGTGYINQVGYIGGIAVAQAGRGIGAAILDWLLEQDIAADPWMSVWTGNTAMLALARSREFVPRAAAPGDALLPALHFQVLTRPDRAAVACLPVVDPPRERIAA